MNQCPTFAELLGYSYNLTQPHGLWRSLINHIAGSCVPDCWAASRRNCRAYMAEMGSETANHYDHVHIATTADGSRVARCAATFG